MSHSTSIYERKMKSTEASVGTHRICGLLLSSGLATGYENASLESLCSHLQGLVASIFSVVQEHGLWYGCKGFIGGSCTLPCGPSSELSDTPRSNTSRRRILHTYAC